MVLPSLPHDVSSESSSDLIPHRSLILLKQWLYPHQWCLAGTSSCQSCRQAPSSRQSSALAKPEPSCPASRITRFQSHTFICQLNENVMVLGNSFGEILFRATIKNFSRSSIFQEATVANQALLLLFITISFLIIARTVANLWYYVFSCMFSFSRFNSWVSNSYWS